VFAASQNLAIATEKTNAPCAKPCRPLVTSLTASISRLGRSAISAAIKSIRRSIPPVPFAPKGVARKTRIDLPIDPVMAVALPLRKH
jgi:hypothetical protein